MKAYSSNTVFCSGNLALSKNTKTRNSETEWTPKWKATGNSGFKQVKRTRNQVDKERILKGRKEKVFSTRI